MDAGGTCPNGNLVGCGRPNIGDIAATRQCAPRRDACPVSRQILTVRPGRCRHGERPRPRICRASERDDTGDATSQLRGGRVDAGGAGERDTH